MTEDERYQAGMQVRRAVLGDTHVDNSLRKLTPFNEEFQEMITRHAWGDIWTRPGLPRHTRSLITIAMLIGMNREGELRLHLKAARNNGVTREEIKEVLMQSAIYCGIPAANATFHLAEEVWDQVGVESLEQPDQG
jgi:4-carboxymuconolactone decarboxylase